MDERQLTLRERTNMCDLTFKTAGHREPLLTVNTNVIRCGHIHDGVSFMNHREGQHTGGWIIAFADLEQIYQSAKAVRDRDPERDRALLADMKFDLIDGGIEG